MGFKQHISRTWQMIEQQVNDVPFRPHDEAGSIIKDASRSLFEKSCAKTLYGYRSGEPQGSPAFSLALLDNVRTF